MANHEEEVHDCPICLEDSRGRDTITLPCTHVFCRKCVDEQFLRSDVAACAYCRQPLFSDANTYFTEARNEDLHPADRIAAYEKCVVAVKDYPTGPNGENKLASAAHHNIGEIYVCTFPDFWRNVNEFPDLELARQNFQLSIEFNPGNHDGLTMIGQCVHGLRRDDADQEAIASARVWWSRALAMNPDDQIAIEQIALTHDVRERM